MSSPYLGRLGHETGYVSRVATEVEDVLMTTMRNLVGVSKWER